MQMMQSMQQQMTALSSRLDQQEKTNATNADSEPLLNLDRFERGPNEKLLKDVSAFSPGEVSIQIYSVCMQVLAALLSTTTDVHVYSNTPQ